MTNCISTMNSQYFYFAFFIQSTGKELFELR